MILTINCCGHVFWINNLQNGVFTAVAMRQSVPVGTPQTWKPSKGDRYMRIAKLLALALIVPMIGFGCSTTPKNDEKKDELTSEVDSSIRTFTAADSSL